jgi:integrase/recombinase XerC
MKGHITMKKAIDAYLDFVYKSRSPKTFATYAVALKTFLDIVGDDALLTKYTYIKFLKSTSDMNPSTQALCRSAIKGMYYFAADIDPSVDTAFFRQTDKRYALKPAKRVILFNQDGIEQIIKHADTIRNKPEDLRDRVFILLLADTGLRISEACHLKIGDVNFLEQKAVVMGKGNKEAVIHISNRVAAAMREYMGARINSPMSSPMFIRHDKRVGDLIKPVKPDGMWHAIKRRAVEAGVDPKTVRPHDFRHYFVTVVYHAKGIRLAQKLARHERIETTSRYTHLVEDEGEAYNEIFNQ